MRFGEGQEEEEIGFQMAPMIDIVFQLLIFFMVATGIIKYESELTAKLPAMTETVEVKKFEELLIEITADGKILANKKEYDTFDSKDLPALKKLLVGLVALYKEQVVIIKAHRDAKYERVIDVLNACAHAKITNVLFSL